MHFNIYLDDKTGMQLTRIAQNLGKSRNALIREAITEWIRRQEQTQWPPEIIEFRGVEDFPPFEGYRAELRPPTEEPLA